MYALLRIDRYAYGGWYGDGGGGGTKFRLESLKNQKKLDKLIFIKVF